LKINLYASLLAMLFFTRSNKNICFNIILYILLAIAFTLTPFITLAQFVTKGDAIKISDRCYKITEDKLNHFGTIWWQEKIDLSQPLELNFTLYLGSKNQNGSDGVAFLFHNDARGFDATGAASGGMGYAAAVEHPNSQPVSPSVAIEFDTYDNNNDEFTIGIDYGDIPADHTTVVYNGDIEHPKLTPVRIDPDNGDVENNTCHDYKITWNPATQELKLYFDGKLRFNHQDDIINKVFKGKTSVYYGFTGSTGGFSNEQTLCLIDPESKPVAKADNALTTLNKPVTIEALKNDYHTKAEPIALTRISRQPANGTITITDNTIVYTPKAGYTGTDAFDYEICEVSSTKCYTKCAEARVNITVGCQVLPQLIIKPEGTLCPGSSITLTALADNTTLPTNANYTYRWSNGETGSSITVNQPGTYIVTLISALGCQTSSAPVKVDFQQQLIIPTAFSPNGDGVNETWEIANIQDFPNAHVEIFNRWGSKIYDAYGYRNEWNGIWNGNLLPTGTYFYVITLEPGRKLTGPVSIIL